LAACKKAGFIRAACLLSGRRAANRHQSAPCVIFARSTSMMDIIMLAIAFVFFAASIAYVYACERL
jgi:hypothetical protein